MKGRTLSKEHKQKLALAKIGGKRTAKTIAKIKQTMLGNKVNHFKKSHPIIPKMSNSKGI